MRVIAGTLRGRRLATPKGTAARPTSDRVREALFNMLTHAFGYDTFQGVHVLDLFAGTGALGIEALSRGAASCVFVENDAGQRALIQENVTNLGLGGTARVFRRDATDLGTSTQRVKFDLVLADPPYGKGLGEAALASAAAGGWLANDATIVLEEAAGTEIALPAGFELVEQRAYGTTQIVFARYESAHA